MANTVARGDAGRPAASHAPARLRRGLRTHARLMFATKFTLWQPTCSPPAATDSRCSASDGERDPRCRGGRRVPLDSGGRRAGQARDGGVHGSGGRSRRPRRARRPLCRRRGRGACGTVGSLRAFRVASEAARLGCGRALAAGGLRRCEAIVASSASRPSSTATNTSPRATGCSTSGCRAACADHALRLGRRAGVDVDDVVRHDRRRGIRGPVRARLRPRRPRAHHVECFDVDQLDAALARYEELEVGRRRASPTRRHACWERGCCVGWPAIPAAVRARRRSAFRCFERRRVVLPELDRAAFLRYTRPLFDLSSAAGLVVEELTSATRDDRFAALVIECAGLVKTGGGARGEPGSSCSVSARWTRRR